nr:MULTISPECIES: hypothetical protein [Vibrio]
MAAHFTAFGVRRMFA